jgi:hypothetical protein
MIQNRKFHLVLLTAFPLLVFGQTHRTPVAQNHAWMMFFGNHALSEKWSIHTEVQIRRADGFSTTQQTLLRTGLNFHLTSTSFATLGYCWVNTHPYGTFPSKSIFQENRIWEQFQNKNQLGKVEWISRFRLEQRWINLPSFSSTTQSWTAGDPVFSNRFRTLQRFSIPFKGTKIEDHSWYLSMYDECLIQFGKNIGLNVFDQNRAYIAIGTKIPKVGRLEFGYLNQFIIKSNGIQVENNHTLQIGLSSTLPLHS